MERDELYCHYFCQYINNKLHIHDMNSPDYVYSDNLDELKENYFNDFIGYQTDGLLSPECIASDNEVSLYLHNYGIAYKDIPVYYAVLENVIDTEYKADNIIVDKGKAYKSKYHDAGMGQDIYFNFCTYWRCISDNKKVEPYQCCLLQKRIYKWTPKIVAGRPASFYKIKDHCTDFSPNYELGEFFRYRIMVMSTEEKLLNDYIKFHVERAISNLEKMSMKLRGFADRLRNNN